MTHRNDVLTLKASAFMRRCAVGQVRERPWSGFVALSLGQRLPTTECRLTRPVVELKLKTPWRDGTTHQVMSPLEFR